MFSFLSIIILNIFIFFFNRNIAQALNLFDNPDKFRKLHKTKVPLTGGIIILLNSALALILAFIEQAYYEKPIIFKNNLDLIILLFSVLIFFLLVFMMINIAFQQIKDFYLF